MNGPFLLLQATLEFARTGLSLYTRLLGPKRAKLLFWGGTAVSTVVVIVLQLKGV